MSLAVAIKKRLGDFALDVAFETGHGTMALLGASGCGKSVTLRCIAGVMRPDSGRIALNGRVLFDSERGIDLPPQQRKVGLLFQQYALFPNMTAEQNIRCVLALSGQDALEERLSALLDRFRLRGFESHTPSQLSGGQQQRVALARILASSPEAILLDEPLSALDSYLRWQLEWELGELFSDYEAPILYVSHNRGEVARLCHRVCVIHEGRAEGVQTTEALFSAPRTLSAALLVGCKSYSRVAVREGVLFASDWNTSFSLPPELPDRLAYVALRDGGCALCERGAPDAVHGTVLGVMNSPRHCSLRLLPDGASLENPRAVITLNLPRAEQIPQKGAAVSVAITETARLLLSE